MTRGERISIPILGINKMPLDDQSIDGLCDSIVNLKPKGEENKPYWVPFEKILNLKNDFGTAFTYEYGLPSITDAFWQIRNYIGEYSENPSGSLRRLIVLCQNSSRKCIDIIEPDTWTVVKTQALPQDGTYAISCTRVDEVSIISVSKDKKPYLLYYVLDDSFIPQGWPEMPEITFSTATISFTTPEIEAGNFEGVLRKAVDQYFMVSWAFRLFDGTTHVRHNRFELVKVNSGTVTEAIRPIFTLDGYVESILINQPFWSSLIAGISVFATLPVTDKKAALDDGKLYEVGYWPFIDKKPEAEWPSVEDPNILIIKSPSTTWPVQPVISTDNFTHHKFSSYVVDSYNKRLLLGGSGVDFALPKIKTNATQNTSPGGVYSDYLNYVSGISTFTNLYFDASGNVLGAVDDPAYNYETNLKEYDASFSPKTGREFKTVTILSSEPGDADINPPGGPTGMPSAAYTAAITAGNLVFSIDTEETNFGSGGVLPNPGAYMNLEVTIGPVGSPADETIRFGISPIGNFAPYFNFSDVQLVNGTVVTGPSVFHVITIKTDAGTYKRILAGNISDTDTEVTLPEVIWYPDARAIKYELIVENGVNFELALSKQLNQHPINNYAYAILSTEEQTFVIGTSIVASTEPDLALNLVLQYVPSRAQAALSGNPFLIDIAATYPVGNRERDIIMGFAVNTNPTSEGQAGQYPVYVLTNKGISALEQTGDPTIAFGRISPVSNFNGVNNPYSFCNAQNLIIAADNKYIYALAGLNAERIDMPISEDPDYPDFIRQMRIGYHRAANYEEVIFSNPFYDYSLCFNMKYRMWYKTTERYKFFFYDYPDLMAMTMENLIKNFDTKDELTPVAWSIQTRQIIFREPYMMKRMFHNSIIRMQWKQPLTENADNYAPLNIKLLGYKDSPNIHYKLLDQTIKTDLKKDWMLYQYFGPMYAYRIIMSGTSQHKGSYLHNIDADYSTISENERRRYDCSSQFLYTEDPASISICTCEDGGNTDAYHVHINNTGTLSEIVTHNLGKVPSVFVTDLEGFVFECGVKLLFTSPGVVDLMRVQLTFEEVIPYKAYFN